MIKLLAISGSLRKQSYNSSLIRALKKISINQIEINIFNNMGSIPLFNPDREDENITVILKLKNALSEADGLIISSPEYAHGITGVLKNTLDWLVSGEEFVNMPIVLFNTSPRANHAQTALREVLKTMSGNVIEEASISVLLLATKLDSEGIINDHEISSSLKMSLEIFAKAILNQQV